MDSEVTTGQAKTLMEMAKGCTHLVRASAYFIDKDPQRARRIRMALVPFAHETIEYYESLVRNTNLELDTSINENIEILKTTLDGFVKMDATEIPTSLTRADFN